MARTYTIVVLDDGDTYSGIDGASIVVMSEEDMDAVTGGQKKLSHVIPITEIRLESFFNG